MDFCQCLVHISPNNAIFALLAYFNQEHRPIRFSVRLLFRQPLDVYFDINVNASMSNKVLDLLKKVNAICNYKMYY